MDFELQVGEQAGRAVLTVAGDLDVQSAPQLRDRISELLDAGSTELVVDLRPAEFIDSSGLSAMVAGLKEVKEHGGDMAVVCPQGKIRRVIEIVALDQVFALYDSVDEATAKPAAG